MPHPKLFRLAIPALLALAACGHVPTGHTNSGNPGKSVGVGASDENRGSSAEGAGFREAPNLLTGTDGDDILIGTPGDDLIEGGAGDDLICGGPCDPTIADRYRNVGP